MVPACLPSFSGLGSRSARSSKRFPEARRVRELQRELKRKDKALTESAALLVLQKEIKAIWGDEDDDSQEDQPVVLAPIEHLTAEVARLEKAADIVDLGARTIQRWQDTEGGEDRRRRVHEQAQSRNPNRWSGSIRDWTPIARVV